MGQATSITLPRPASESRRGPVAQAAGYFAAFVALGLTTASLGPTLPGLAENVGAQLSEISFLFTARSLGFLVGSLRGGRLYDRVAGNPVMAVMIVCMAAAMAAVPLMSRLWSLTLVMLVLGAAEGLLDVGGNTLLVWAASDRVGPLMSGLHFFFGVGAFVSPIIVARALLFISGVSLPYWALALLVLPVAVWLLAVPSPAPQKVIEESAAPGGNRRLVALVALFFFLYLGAELSFSGWIYSYAVALTLSSAESAAYLTSAFWGSFTLGRLLSIPVAARLRPRVILAADFAGSLASLGAILVWSESPAAVWLGTCGLGVSMASIFPTAFSLAGRRLTITGRVTGWFLAGASVGGMFLPWFIGQLLEPVGPRVVMVVVAADLLAAAAVFLVLVRQKKK